MTAVDLLRRQLQNACDRIRSRVEGLTDDEFFWEPVPDCWTVRQDDRGRLTNWGEQWPTWRVFWTMIDHDSLHDGEIGALRDLYRCATPGSSRC